jgi:hypothetical protein
MGGEDKMGILSKKTTYDPMSAYTPEQRKSIEALQSLAATGTGGGITLGTKYGGSLGSFNLTDQTRSGLEALQNLLLGANNPDSDMGKARSVYSNLANNSIFDLDSDQSGYKAYSKALAKAGLESADVLNREAAMSGNRFSTSMGRDKADLAENLQLQRAQQLANLFQGSQQTAALGAQGLTGLANMVADLSGMNITYGDMQRQMEDAQAMREYQEFNRGRNEQLMRLGIMQDQMNNPMGIITTEGPSMLAKMVGQFDPTMGSYNQQKYGYTTGQQTWSSVLNPLQGYGVGTGAKSSGGGTSSGGQVSYNTGSLSNSVSGYNQGSSSALSSNVTSSYPTGNISYAGVR